ncbi:FYN-binding protein 1-like isoform 2-T2 [Discoglossus pictus]
MTCFPARHLRSRQSIGESRGLYEDVLRFCPIQKEKSASLQSFVIPETPPRPDSVEEVYDDVETIAEKSKPPLPEPRNLIEENTLITNWRNETNLKKMERLEREFRKNFQYNGQVKVLTRMMVDPNAIVRKPGEKDLAYTRGEIMDVIELTSVEKVLCRNYGGKFGYMPRTALLRIEKNVYDSVLAAEEVYDDTELISTTFPAVPPKQRFQNGYVTRMFQRNQSQLSKGSSKAEITKKEISKNNKKEEKELKELKKKFKFEGEVKVLTRMMVVPSAGNRRGGFKDLSISKGEIFEVIQYTNQEKLLCRNTKGKYGYVKRKYVLQLENDLYDDAETLSSGAINRRI